MTRILKAVIACCLLPVIATGCWDLKDPQDINYFTALGFDYVNGEYKVYGQLLDLAAVAKSESGSMSSEPQIWVGIGTGETPSRAINDLYDTAQLRVFYGHVDAIVLSESVLKQGVETIFDVANRYYEMRYTPWLFATNSPIDTIMNATFFFNMSPFLSLLHQPLESFKQKSKIPPKESRAFIQQFREPSNTAVIPSLDLVDDQWQKDQKFQKVLDIDGVFIFRNEEYKGKLMQNELMGFRWVRGETNRSPVYLHRGGKISNVLSLERPKVNVTPRLENGKVKYLLEVKLSGNIVEIFIPHSQEEMEKLAEQYVAEEIRDTYERALALDADILRLEHALYRKNNRLWKQMHSKERLKLTPDSLEITVDVKLDSSGKIKMHRD